jgi:hypothetical protein
VLETLLHRETELYLDLVHHDDSAEREMNRSFAASVAILLSIGLPAVPGCPPSAIRSLNGPSSTLTTVQSVTDETCHNRILLVDPTLIDPEMQDCNPVSLNRNNRASFLH